MGVGAKESAKKHAGPAKPVGGQARSENQTTAAAMPQEVLTTPERPLSTTEVLSLQRLIGNGAVQRLLARRTGRLTPQDENGVAEGAEAATAVATSPSSAVGEGFPLSRHAGSAIHRAWSDADPGSYPAPKDPSQPATPAGGWNASNQTIGGVERIPLEGLKEGLQSTTHRSQLEIDDEKAKSSKESPDGKAIAIVPTALKPDQPVEVLLHLHGHNVGYRERAKSDGPGMEPGSVRDVAADKIEQQLGASGRNMIAILPQGTTESGFGAFKPEAYITEVWGMLTTMKKLPQNAKRGAVVLSGHSGAASPINQMLSSGNLPTGLGELVLFDSIHGGQRPTVETFLKSRMSADVKALKDFADPHLNGGIDAAAVTTKQTDYLAHSFRFRGIFTPKFHPQKKDDQGHLVWLDPPTNKKPAIDETKWEGYGVQYEPLRDTIKTWIDNNTKGLDASLVAALRENYKVIPAGAGATHNTIMSANNNLQSALSALPSATPPSTPVSPPPVSPPPVKTGEVESTPTGESASEVASNTPAETAAETAEETTVQAKREPFQSQSARGFRSESVRAFSAPENMNARASNTPGVKIARRREGMGGDSLLHRQPNAAPLTDQQQWDQDWTSHVGQQGYFAGGGRPTGTPRQRYDVLCPLYKSHGIARPMVYMASSITTAKFYGFSTPAHNDLAAALTRAETTLKGKGYANAPVTSVWALNPRTTSTGAWSNHADGKAVDIDPDNNPHLIDQKERKIISLVSGTDIDQGSQGYDAMKGASDQFKANYNPAGLKQRIIELQAAEKAKETERDTTKSERDTLKTQRQQLKTDRSDLQKQLKTVPHGKSATADDKAKAAELTTSIQQKDAALIQIEKDIKQKEVDLKKKESELKAATKDRELLERQLAAYEATESAISNLENSVKSLPDEIKALEDQIAQSKLDEQDAKTAKNSDGVKAQQKLRSKLEQSLKKDKADLKKNQTQLDKKKKERDADPLRQYAAGGVLNLSKDVVEAMTGAGLRWGGNWTGAKDFMHFEL